MSLPARADESRRRVRALLADDRVPAPRLLEALERLAGLDAVPAFALALSELARLEVPEKLARRLWVGLLEHREALTRELGRDPGLRVAVLDYLINREARLRAPVVVEQETLELVERSATRDPLTGLFNRGFMEAVLDREMRRCRRYGLELSVVMLDLDDFKGVNDAWGHGFGDRVLRRVGRLVRGAVRDSDSPCRYGGEEFLLILPETDRLGAYAVAERVRRRVERWFEAHRLEGRDVRLTLSGGIAHYPEDARGPQELVSRADASLYRAKAQGKGRVALHYAERRRDVRFPPRPGVRVQLAPASAGGPTPAVPRNLSRGGVLVETRVRFETGDRVRVQLGGSGEPTWVIEGRVVRVEPCGALPSFIVGVAFSQPLPEPCLVAQARVAQAVAAGGAPR